MSEKSFLCYRTGIWLQAIAGILIILYSMLTLFFTWVLIVQSLPQRVPLNETMLEDAWDEDVLSELEIEKMPSFLSIVCELLFFILSFLFAIAMAAILLWGYKQRNVQYLKAWIVFAVFAVLTHLLLLVVFHGDLVALIAMIIFVPIYAPSVWIANLHINGILGEQEEDGENLPRYEVQYDEVL